MKLVGSSGKLSDQTLRMFEKENKPGLSCIKKGETLRDGQTE